MTSTPTMANIWQLLDASVVSNSNDHSNHNDESRGTGKNDTTKAANSSRVVTFDDTNERTRLYAEEAIAAGHDVSAHTMPPTYSRSHRDSGVSVGSESCNSSQTLTMSHDGLSPSSPSKPSLSSSRSAAARPPRLVLEKDNGKPLGLGPAMEQWRLEEEEEERNAGSNGESATLAPKKSRSSFSDGRKRRISLGAAMEQWRLEEDEEWQNAKRNGEAVPVLLTPTLVPPPMSPSWSVLSGRSSQSHLGPAEGRRMSLGPAMDQWRIEEDNEQRAAKQNGEPVPALLSPTSPRPQSAWPSRSSFGQEDGRRPSLGPAMDQWRVEEDDELRATKRNGESIPELLPPKSPRPRSEWPSEWPTRSSFGQEDGRRPSLGSAMEKWRLEEELDGPKSAAPVPSASPTAPQVASGSMHAGKSDRIMTLGPAMEAWRQEAVDW